MDQTLFGGILFAATILSALGQLAGNRYEALQHALGLNDSQVRQLQHKSPTRNADSLRGLILDDAQQTKLTVIGLVLERSEMASRAIVLG